MASANGSLGISATYRVQGCPLHRHRIAAETGARGQRRARLTHSSRTACEPQLKGRALAVRQRRPSAFKAWAATCALCMSPGPNCGAGAGGNAWPPSPLTSFCAC